MRLRKVDLFICKKRIPTWDLSTVWNYLIGRHREEGVRLKAELHRCRISGSRYELEHVIF